MCSSYVILFRHYDSCSLITYYVRVCNFNGSIAVCDLALKCLKYNYSYNTNDITQIDYFNNIVYSN